MRTRDTLFRATKAESKADSTTRVAREIIEAETSARDLKVQRLRAARLEKEAAAKIEDAAKPRKGSRGAARSKSPTGS